MAAVAATSAAVVTEALVREHLKLLGCTRALEAFLEERVRPGLRPAAQRRAAVSAGRRLAHSPLRPRPLCWARPLPSLQPGAHCHPAPDARPPRRSRSWAPSRSPGAARSERRCGSTCQRRRRRRRRWARRRARRAARRSCCGLSSGWAPASAAAGLAAATVVASAAAALPPP
ncbi:MAG: hypothetical protein J3K34DRAFT_164992 [Monoraphidium minutum]|nr:MAG: hypothetical protein J3K34DRAFT_164992 [Monoraphidium minutum]